MALPKAPFRIDSLKRYLVELSMVVLGILIALTLEGWRDTRREADLVAHSVTAMRSEIEFNKARVQRVRENYERTRPLVLEIKQLIESILNARADKKPAPTPPERERTLQLEIPTLISGAWQASLATDALTFMEYEQAQLWSTTYAIQDQVGLFQKEWIGFYGRLAPLNQVSDSSSTEALQQQLQLSNELLLRMSIMQTGWSELIKRYDAALANKS